MMTAMTSQPVIEGIVETILYVDDLARAVAFYRDVLGLRVMAGDGVRFQALNPGGRQVLLLFKRGGTLEPLPVPTGGVIPPHDGRGPHHLGFAITHEAYEPWRERLAAAGVAIESEAKWARGGRSLYFRDPDGHVLELLTPGLWPNY
jgi:catechol 2,3-dioxygenase-like lactoylglutathione lyase family enzyme